MNCDFLWQQGNAQSAGASRELGIGWRLSGIGLKPQPQILKFARLDALRTGAGILAEKDPLARRRAFCRKGCCGNKEKGGGPETTHRHESPPRGVPERGFFS